MSETTYPKRPKFFAQKFSRLLFKTCAAAKIGSDGVALLVCIVTTEDAARYRRPVTYSNTTLMSMLGVRKWERLARIRGECIKEGWLTYIPPPIGRRRSGEYFVCIPPECEGLDDSPTDEGDHQCYPVLGERSEPTTPEAYPENGYAPGYAPGYAMGELSYPVPNPDPKEERALISPDDQTISVTTAEASFIAAVKATSGMRPIRGGRLTKKRRDLFVARCRDDGWLEDYPQALARFPLKCFAADPDGWQPNVDWFLRPDTVTRILEGEYDWTKERKNGLPPSTSPVQEPGRVRTGKYKAMFAKTAAGSSQSPTNGALSANDGGS